MKTLIFLCLLISANILSQNAWVLKPTLTTENITDIDYAGSSVWYASMEAGLILKSTTDGETWFVQATPVTQHLWTIDFIDANTGWAAGNDGQIIKTTNGGVNWVIQVSGIYPRFNEIGFINSNTGFAVGSNGVINKTTNGGTLWFLQMSTTTNDLYGISFSQLSGGGGTIVGANGTILRTTDLGGSWTYIGTGSAALYDVIFQGGTGYAIGSDGSNNIIKKSTNAGFSWSTLTALFPQTMIDVFFTNQTTGWVVGNEGYISRTTDGGLNWVHQPTFWNQDLSAVRFINQYTGIAAGNNGYVLKTTNGGDPIGIEQISSGIPEEFSISQNYPNPFNPSTNIEINISKNGHIKIVIYNVTGMEIETIINTNLSPGKYRVDWNASGHPSGIYFARMTGENYSGTIKMMLTK